MVSNYDFYILIMGSAKQPFNSISLIKSNEIQFITVLLSDVLYMIGRTVAKWAQA